MSRRLMLRRPSLATGCAALMAVLLLAGALAWYLPPLRAHTRPMAEVPAPPALFFAARLSVPAHRRACQRSVTVTSDSRVAQFDLFPAPGATSGGPPIRFTLGAPGYHAQADVSGGYPGGAAALPITPPPHDVIATACFANLGSAPLILVGSTEGRTVARPAPVTIGHRSINGDVVLSFSQGRSAATFRQLETLFLHASRLVDGLVPPLIIWLVALLTGFGVPLAVIAAVWLALREDPRRRSVPDIRPAAQR